MSRTRLPLSVAATLMAGPAMADVPDVAVDIAPVHSLVARVMEGVGTPDLIVAPGASPHEYSLRPSEASALQEADLVFWIGPDLTPWLEDAIGTVAAGAQATALLEVEGVTRLPIREGALFEAHAHDHGAAEAAQDGHDAEDHAHDNHGEDHAHEGHDSAGHDDHGHDDDAHEDHGEDHAHGDHDSEGHDDHAHDDHAHEDHAHDEAGHDDHDHGAHDPHAWLSPDNAAVWLTTIAAGLSQADPDNAGAYYANATEARAELETLSDEIDAALDPVRDGRFIVFHDAYQYFEEAFDLPAAGAISISDATDPSPARVAEVRSRVAEQGVTCVLAEPQFDPGIVTAVMEGTEAGTGVLDPLGSDLAPGPELYPHLLRNLTQSLADCL
ncbi:MAG: zinc ABC transporter substrate-binding protein [Salibaculum sp.]|uniref:zinc ABC transporter substrate-binding protein n=1 Tax=Salibaculum sp. TaxID=2855480 RepID=UPI00286FFB75|nr:zinc ABC transporter substrate-binding protein [Salibaculum sp.]MDR9427672.1 zinc ABC transporter substrate-binding protein [Salibaculum sp.]MDR9481586.1 zinc ABC transporter substrate-binding protein [Salibaculum sp.]